MKNQNCPCGNINPYSTCCEPFITGKSFPETAEQLMRSRYTAFTNKDIDYLMESHHPSTRPVKERKQMIEWMKTVQWLGLKVLSFKAGQKGDNSGYVEFKALYLEEGRVDEIYENAYFERLKGRWVYVSGEHF